MKMQAAKAYVQRKRIADGSGVGLAAATGAEHVMTLCANGGLANVA